MKAATLKGARSIAHSALDNLLDAILQVGNHSTPGAPVRQKPGPKPGAKKTAAKKAQVQVRSSHTGVKATVKKKAGAKSTSTHKGAKSGRRLIDDMQTVMQSTIGQKSVMDANQVFAELKKHRWLPNSNDPLGYVRYTLSANESIFHRAEGQRGKYFLGSTTAKKSAPKPAPAPVATAPETTEETIEPTVAAAPAPAPTPAAAPKAAPVVAVAVAAPVAPPKVVAKPAPAPVVEEEEDPSKVADDILKDVGIDLTT